MFADGARDSHATVGPTPPPSSHQPAQKAFCRQDRADLLAWALWALWVDQSRVAARDTCQAQAPAWPVNLWAFWVIALEVRFRLLISLPKTPKNRRGYMRGVKRGQKGFGSFKRFKQCVSNCPHSVLFPLFNLYGYFLTPPNNYQYNYLKRLNIPQTPAFLRLTLRQSKPAPIPNFSPKLPNNFSYYLHQCQ